MATSGYYKLSYVHLVNVARGKLPLGSIVELYGELGPKFGYLVGYSKNLNQFVDGDWFYVASGNDINRFCFGLIGGIGILLKLGNINLGIDFSRNLNFVPVMDAVGPRADNRGDEGFYLKLREQSNFVNIKVIHNLQ